LKDREQEKAILYRCNEYALVAFTGVAFLLVLGGMALYLASPVKTAEPVPLRMIWEGLLQSDPSSVIAAGIVTLFMLPIALSIISTVVMAWKKEKFLALASFAVLVFLCISVWLAIS
jgi:uncharacterized membrane protein